MLFATVAGILGLPLLAPAAVAVDLVRGRWRLPTLRVYLFVLQYALNDSAEIVAAPVLWLAAGAGTRLGSAASIARHERLQWWSVAVLIRRADRLLGLRMVVEPDVEQTLRDGPVIVISRHVSLFDASLPGLVCHRSGLQTRGVIMAELLADPGFDLLYRRLGSIFIPRDDGARAIAAIEAMAATAGPDTAFVIFPEGRLFTPERRDRSLARLEERDPERAERLAGLAHVLPPRPNGVLSLLDGLPSADVVVVEHTGLDRLGTVRDLFRLVPLDEPVRVTVRRIPRRMLPTTRDEQARWLDELWLSLDDTPAPEPASRHAGDDSSGLG